MNQRLDVLLKVKWIVQPFNDVLAKDIIELIDREADLLNRGRPLKSMEKLRVRLQHLFLELIKTPDFNPSADEYIGVTMSLRK